MKLIFKIFIGALIFSSFLLISPSAKAIDSTIQGSIETISKSGKIQGWAVDTDSPSASIQIHIYVNGKFGEGGTIVGGADANILRSDVNAAYGITGNHGFLYQLPTEYLDGLSHTFYIYGINIEGTPGGNALLGNNPYIYTYSSIDGNFDRVSSNKLEGWAIDLDNTSSSILLHIYVGGEYGKGGTIVGGADANILRPDVNSALGITGNHGFSYQIPETYLDGKVYSFYVYGINIEGTTGGPDLLKGSPKEFSTSVPVYRFFNKANGGHFYTIDAGEKADVMKLTNTWNFEGEKYRVLPQSAENTIPVYRFFNSITGAHLYVTDENEKNTIQNTLPQYLYEGIKYYVYKDSSADLKAVYRFFNKQNGIHLYTTSLEETENIIQTLSYFQFEGVKYYVL